MVENYKELANSIIIRAVKDYKYVLKKCKKHPYSKVWEYEKKKLERFFKSLWYKTLTNLDGIELMRKIKEEMIYDC